VKHIKEVHQKLSVANKMYGEERPYKCLQCNGSLKEEVKNSPYHKCFMLDMKIPALKTSERVDTKTFNEETKMFSEEKVIQCNQCPQVFKQTDYYRNHLMTVHNDVRSFQCEQCKYAAKTPFLLNKHFRAVHQKDKPNVCHICGKGYYDIYFLKKHLEKHDNPEDENSKSFFNSKGSIF
jgi:hypothetical protein